MAVSIPAGIKGFALRIRITSRGYQTRIKTHTFRKRRYIIEETDYIGGVTDVPDDGSPPRLLFARSRHKLTELDNILHEGMEAMRIPSRFLHTRTGESATMDLARFLWRAFFREKGK